MSGAKTLTIVTSPSSGEAFSLFFFERSDERNEEAASLFAFIREREREKAEKETGGSFCFLSYSNTSSICFFNTKSLSYVWCGREESGESEWGVGRGGRENRERRAAEV